MYVSGGGYLRNKLGFTLIELLAVIVILAIIASIAIPIVLSIIKNTQIAADKRSLESYAKIIETAHYKAKMENSSLSLKEYLNKLEKGEEKISYKGSKIECEEKRSVIISNKETLELNGCMINGRGPYRYVNQKAERYNIYIIKMDIENVEIDPEIKTIEEGKKYTTQIKINEGYKIEEENIEIKMDGKDIKSKSYSAGKIEIEKVTGDIEIKIKGTKKTYEVISELANVKVTSDTEVIEHGEKYQATLTPDNLYEIDSVTITMNDEDITSSYNAETKTIEIEKVTGNIKITASAITSQFAIDSWPTIISNVKIGNTDIYNLGDTKMVDLGELGKHRVRVANKSNDDPVCTSEINDEGSTNSKTACGFVIEFVDIITIHNVNTGWTNSGGWSKSEMRLFVTPVEENSDSGTIYNALPEELKAGIIDTTVVSGRGKLDEEQIISTDKLYLLSTKEIRGGTSSYDTACNETRQLDYYKSIGVTSSNTSGAIKQYEGSDYGWWTRSASFGHTDRFFVVSTTGSTGALGVRNALGVSPAFRIGE